MALERLQSPPRDTVFSWNWPKVVRAVDKMEEDSRVNSGDFDIGHASTLHALCQQNLHSYATGALLMPL